MTHLYNVYGKGRCIQACSVVLAHSTGRAKRLHLDAMAKISEMSDHKDDFDFDREIRIERTQKNVEITVLGKKVKTYILFSNDGDM